MKADFIKAVVFRFSVIRTITKQSFALLRDSISKVNGALLSSVVNSEIRSAKACFTLSPAILYDHDKVACAKLVQMRLDTSRMCEE